MVARFRLLSRSVTGVLLVAGVLAALVVPAASTAALTGASPPRVAVVGTVPAALASARPLGLAPASQRLSLQVDLRLRHSAELQAAIRGLSDPRSPGFQRFLTPAQLTARYGPTEAELRAVETYLRSDGITITSASPQRNMIDASTTVSVADRAFGVKIRRWRGARGLIVYSPGTNPVLPASVARLVLAISGLDDLARLRPNAVTCTTSPLGGSPSGTCAEPAGVSNLGYGPRQLQKAYGLTQLAQPGLCGPKIRCNGKGQYIGILQFQSSWDPADESTFDSQYGLNIPSPSATAFCSPTSPCPIPVDSSNLPAIREADLDVEVAHAIAPGARVLVYQTTKDVFSGLGDLLATMLNGQSIATTNSVSYGTCEADVGSSQAMAMDQEFAMLAMRGQVFFAASGDSGQYCFNDAGGQETGPNYPASDPLVTSVGGTNLLLNSDGSYAYEYAWSESGGGASTIFPRPSWQQGPGVPAGPATCGDGSQPCRLVPDVSADAFCSIAAGCSGNPADDYDITGPGTNYPGAGLGFSERTYCTPTTQCWASNGGTSLASPLWASLAAVYNQFAESTGKTPLNANVSAQLYNLAFLPHLHAGAITDVTYQAENGADLYQNAGDGWDGATGVGSPQAYTMASDLPGVAIKPYGGPPGTAVTVTGTAFAPGETVTVADSTGSPAAICSAPAGSDGSFTCAGTIPSSSSYGAQQIVATGADSAGQAGTVFDVVHIGTWELTGPMVSPHGQAPTTELTDGWILAVSGDGGGDATAVSEVYEPAAGVWTQTGNVNQPREDFGIATLNTGDVLIAGGTDSTASTDYGSAELYDPSTGQWSYTGSLNTPRRYLGMVKLNSGKVLAISGAHGPPDGNRFLFSCELYNPTTGKWSYTGNVPLAREGGMRAVLLHNGKVLLLGGEGPWLTLSPETELYNPKAGTWSSTGNLAHGVAWPTVTVLQDGRVLLAGGQSPSGTPYADAEIYKPRTGKWSSTGSMNYPRSNAAAALLPDGRVLVSGGDANGTSEIYNPATGHWTIDAAMQDTHVGGHTTLLGDGTLLMTGGYDANGATTTAEIYQPPTSP